MSFAIYPKYHNIYEGKKPTIESLLSDISSQFIINFACFVNAKKHLDIHNYKVDNDVFYKLIENLEDSKRRIISKKMQRFSDEIFALNEIVILFPLPTMLRLIQHEIFNFKSGSSEPINPLQEENILKAILVLNQIEEEDYIKRAKRHKAKGDLDTLIGWLWPNLLPIFEFQHRKEILLPLHFAIGFFQYLESNKNFLPYLEYYYSLNNVNSYKEFLKKLIDFYLKGYIKQENKFHFSFDKDILKFNNVITQYILDTENLNIEEITKTEKDKNFKFLRETPIIKFKDGNYCITNWNFFIDKYYQAQKFDFFHFSGIENFYKGGDKNKKFQTFNGDLGQNFIEKQVFLKTMHKYLPLSGGLIIEEDRSKRWIQDLYYRYENNITFIEFKSVAFPINDRLEEIKKVVDSPEKILKAVYQIVFEIKELLNNINKFENLSSLGYDKADLTFYPAIVYTDIAWSLPGLNAYYNRIFWEEIKKENISISQVNDIVMIHIDFFYEYEKLFLKDRMSFHKILWEHNMQRAISIEASKKIFSAKTVMEKYAHAYFYFQKKFPTQKTNIIESSVFETTIKSLEFPNNTI